MPAAIASTARETGRAIVVLRLHQRTETRRHREVAERRNVGADEQAERRGPHVHMRIDESRDADHPGAVDHLSRGRLDPLGDGDDRAVADMHVAAGEVGHGGIHGEHGGAADDELAARRQRRARRCGIARSVAQRACAARALRSSTRWRPAEAGAGSMSCVPCVVPRICTLSDDIRNGGTRKEEAPSRLRSSGRRSRGSSPFFPLAFAPR